MPRLSRYAVCLAVLLVFGGALGAQEAAPRPIDRELWRESLRSLRYGEAKAEPAPEERQQPLYDDGGFEFGENLMEGLLIVLGVALLVLIVLHMSGVRPWRGLRRERPVKVGDMAVDALERDLANADLASPLDQALRGGQYALALRLLYLGLIQTAAGRGLIAWRRYKTNHAYRLEMRRHEGLGEEFDALTTLFDEVRYGERPVGAADFASIRPRFDAFLEALKRR